MKKMTTCLAFLLLFVFQSCKEEDAIEPIIENQESEVVRLLTSGTWTRVGFERNGVDVYQIFPDCVRDDVYAYQKDGSAYVDQGVDICDTASAQRVGWTWELIENETQIKEVVSDTNVIYRHILKLTESEFQFASYYLDQDTLIFTHIKN